MKNICAARWYRHCTEIIPVCRQYSFLYGRDNMRQISNPFLLMDAYIADREPHVFGEECVPQSSHDYVYSGWKE